MSINVGQQASDFLERDWLMMLMMSSANGGFERQKVRLVLDDEFPGFYKVSSRLRELATCGYREPGGGIHET